MKRILYVASTKSHLDRFHQPYLERLRTECNVYTMANGEGVDFKIAFQKRFFSLKNLWAIWSIRRIFHRERFDGVILNTSLAAFLSRLAMVGLRNRPRVLNIVHGYLFDLPLRGFRNRLMLLYERLVAPYTDQIAVMNEADLRIAKKFQLAKGKVCFIKGMGYTLEAASMPRDLALRQRLVSPEETLLTYVGELSERKNQGFLIRCVYRLRARGIPVRLMLVGEGGARGKLDAQIRELGLTDVVMPVGNHEPILPYLAITDLYVSASRIEGLPFNVMEAMECGLPMILSDCKGQRDLLREHPNQLYPLGDEAAFCRLVEEALKGKLGVGAVEYKGLEAYTLESVFLENLNIMKGFF